MENILPNLAEFIPMLLAFIILFVVLSKFAWPMITETLDKRQAAIAEAVESAEEAKLEGERLLSEHKATIAAKRGEATKAIEDGNAAAEKTREEIVAAAHKEAEDIKARAAKEIEEEKRAAAAELQASVADISVAVASKLIGKNFSAADDKALIEQFVKDSDFAREYGEAKKADGSTVAEVTTAVALDDSTRALLVEKLTAAVGGPVTLDEIVNENVVGGISVNIDGRVVDGTLSTQLAAVKAALTQGA